MWIRYWRRDRTCGLLAFSSLYSLFSLTHTARLLAYFFRVRRWEELDEKPPEGVCDFVAVLGFLGAFSTDTRIGQWEYFARDRHGESVSFSAPLLRRLW